MSRPATDDEEQRPLAAIESPGPIHPPTSQFRLHQTLVDHLALQRHDVLVDLGCGHGITLAVAAERSTGATLVGLDVDAPSLRTAASWVGSLGARPRLAVADLSTPLPLADDSVTKTVCHDLLECLPDPLALMVEASRVLRPGGISVWSHVDYDSTVVAGGDRNLTRRIVHAYADYVQPWMTSNDGQMGRKLAGLVRRSPLCQTALDAQVMTSSELLGPARMRIDDIASTLRRGAGEGTVDLTPDELDGWTASLAAADADGAFFYAQTAYVVVASNSGEVLCQ